MRTEVQSHIFERFYQGDASRSASGNGLGSPTVRRIVELCGGTIEVESDVRVGSCFVVTL
ncbi:MAG: sensor histidine kinase [Coriobacteriia bacterium]|nr:sensor histidine kinase [Coriobacteriia bacterium]